jgi:hypothetical protein
VEVYRVSIHKKALIYRAFRLLCISPEFTGVVFGGSGGN